MTSTYVFDAYGTLFDVHSAVARHRERVGAQAEKLSDLWRTKQLEYTWIRTMCGTYRDFAALTAEALDYAAARCGGIDAAVRADLIASYEQLEAFTDVKPTLATLKARGARLAILSNGTPAMLASAVAHAGLGGLFEAILSVDPLKLYKTADAAYSLVGQAMGVKPRDVSFQSSNRWDIAGAAHFGFRAIWINRAGLPDEYSDMAPQRILSSLAPLAND